MFYEMYNVCGALKLYTMPSATSSLAALRTNEKTKQTTVLTGSAVSILCTLHTWCSGTLKKQLNREGELPVYRH